jgi:hypothetical protein
MKYTKRMLLLPEDEYAALMDLFTGGDKIKAEKVQTESQMLKILENPRLSQLEKGKKADMLYKKNRKLNKVIAEKSFRENMKKDQNPLMGITPTPENNLQEIQQELIENVQEEAEPEAEEVAPEPVVRQPPKSKLGEFKNIVKREKYGDLKRLVEEDKQKFGIKNNGIISNLRNDWEEPIGNYKDLLKYMTGEREEFDNTAQKKVALIFIKRLLKDDRVKEMLKDQRGEGKRKRYIVEVKMKKSISRTPGLPRGKFKPIIWTKLGV